MVHGIVWPITNWFKTKHKIYFYFICNLRTHIFNFFKSNFESNNLKLFFMHIIGYLYKIYYLLQTFHKYLFHFILPFEFMWHYKHLLPFVLNNFYHFLLVCLMFSATILNMHCCHTFGENQSSNRIFSFGFIVFFFCFLLLCFYCALKQKPLSNNIWKKGVIQARWQIICCQGNEKKKNK